MTTALTREEAHKLVCDTALLLDRATVGSSNSRDAWRIAANEVVYEVEYDAGRDKVVAVLHIVDVGRALGTATCEMLLRYNCQWRTTGGLRIGLDDVPGRLTLIAELGATTLVASRLATAMSNMATVAGAWAEIVTSAEAMPLAGAADSPRFHDLA